MNGFRWLKNMLVGPPPPSQTHFNTPMWHSFVRCCSVSRSVSTFSTRRFGYSFSLDCFESCQWEYLPTAENWTPWRSVSLAESWNLLAERQFPYGFSVLKKIIFVQIFFGCTIENAVRIEIFKREWKKNRLTWTRWIEPNQTKSSCRERLYLHNRRKMWRFSRISFV